MQIFNDFNTSVKKALEEIDPKYMDYGGLVICGTHTPSPLGVIEEIREIRHARETGLPFLGICMGHQLAFIEYCRNVLGQSDATSEEFSQKGTFVVKKRPEGLKVGLHYGETYWHNYECLGDWEKPPNFITCQYHPEYQSSIDNPHPLLVKFIELCKKKKK